MIGKYQGVYFIKELGTDARQTAIHRETAGQKRASFWGSKFETYIFAENGKVWSLLIIYIYVYITEL